MPIEEELFIEQKARGIWQHKVDMVSDDIVPYNVKLFGQFEKYEKPYDPINMLAGKFFLYQDGKLPEETHKNALKDSSLIFFDGIDMNPLTTAKRCKYISECFDGGIAAYHYNASMKMMSKYLVKLLEDNDNFSTRIHGLSAKAYNEGIKQSKNESKTILRYSNGVFFGGSFDNAILNEAQKPQYRVFNIGVAPLWTFDSFKEGKYFAQKDFPEINIHSGSDLMAPVSSSVQALMTDFANGKRKEDFVIFNHENDPNKIFVFIRPGLVPIKVGDNINFGGHGLPHYLAVFGINGQYKAPTKELEALGQILKSFIAGDLDLGKTNLTEVLRANNFQVEPFGKAITYSEHKEDDFKAQIEVYSKQIKAEYQACVEMKKSYPILGIQIPRQSLSYKGFNYLGF